MDNKTPVSPETQADSTLRSEMNWLSLTLQEVSRALEMPGDGTMKDLPALAADRMAELKRLRASATPVIKPPPVPAPATKAARR